MRNPQITTFMLAGFCLLAGCSGKPEPQASTAAPAAPERVTVAPAQSGNAAQGGGVKLENPSLATSPDGGGIKNP